MRCIRLTVLSAGTALLGSSLYGQNIADAVEQIGSQKLAPIQQISNGSRRIETPLRAGTPEERTTAPQLSSGWDSNPRSGQLTNEQRGVRGAVQIYTGERTALPSDALSRPSEGRTGVAPAVGGNDRCDPLEGADEQLAAVCSAVIERRAAEFSSPEAPQLSPEQRLLAEQRVRESGYTTRDASRRLARNGETFETGETQGVASMAFSPPPASPDANNPRPADAQGLSEATLTILNAIVAGAQNTPPR